MKKCNPLKSAFQTKMISLSKLLLNPSKTGLRLMSSVTSELKELRRDTGKVEDTLKYQDYFGVHNLFTVKDLFDARVHLGHKDTALNPRMKPFVFGTRYVSLD